MEWNIVADSSCDLFAKNITDDRVDFTTVPFAIQIGEKEYWDEEDLSVPEMLGAMEASKQAAHTACPSPGRFLEAFSRGEKTVAITISRHLSGSFESASTARQMLLQEDPNKQILILDSCSTGPEPLLCIYHLRKWMHEGLSMQQIAEKARVFLDRTHVVFALSSFDNLVKNGRMSRLVGFAARTLGMWGIGIGTDQGEIKMEGKARGKEGALRIILADMEKRGFAGKEVAISHCLNKGMALRLEEQILARWPEAKVTIRRTRGLDSFYAERGGLIVAYGS